jgi:D-alanyl-lipoteichoic acid acyltransferase DltB (MBOAT superfamily)
VEITGFSYLIFFVAVLLMHQLLAGRDGWQKLMLSAASYYFYATVDWRFTGLLMGITVVNWLAGQVVASRASARVRRAAVVMAVIATLGILCYFKYLNFFASMVNSLTAWLGHGSLVPLVGVLLPVGLSFLTFQAITYPIDLYAGRLAKPASFNDFVLFMAFFPRLLAGPIVPAAYFLPQLQRKAHKVSNEQRFEGAALIMRGLIKKVILADTLGMQLVDPAFSDPNLYSTGYLWLAVFAYSLQTYLDLSGYTDMALGAGQMLGYRLPANFNRPYMATSVANFWQRWHISMSSFFGAYLYTPLRTAYRWPSWVNLQIVFVAIGLWHGAGWNFILYGMLHGTMVALEHWRNQRRRARGQPIPVYHGLRLALQIGFVFTLVSLARVLFRSTNLQEAGEFLSAMVTPGTGYFPLSVQAALAIMAALLLHWTPVSWRERFMAWVSRQPAWLFGVQFAALCYTLVAFSNSAASFIYYQF